MAPPRLAGTLHNPVRLFVAAALAPAAALALAPSQAHYLGAVMRLRPGQRLLVFNGRDGEWIARIESLARKSGVLALEERLRAHRTGSDLHLLFAPVKHARIDYLAAKATEIGVSALRPVLTERTQVARVNLERLRVNAIEAAEQCGRLDVPAVEPAAPFATVFEAWDARRRLLFCDEEGGVPIARALLDAGARASEHPWAVLVGPEGGFGAAERSVLRRRPEVLAVSLGPRLLRAETAAIAALSVWQALLGEGGLGLAPTPDRLAPDRGSA